MRKRKSFRLPPVALAGRTEPHPEKSPLRGKTSVSSFESRTLKATRLAKICFQSARGRFGGGNFALDLDRLHRYAVCKTCISTTGAKAKATTIVDHEMATSSTLLPSPASGQQSCCFFFSKAFVVAPPRSKRARVHVERTFRPRRPARSLRRRVHVGVRPFVRFSRAAKDREEARFHCWRFFVTGVFGTPAAFAFALRRRGARGV